MTLASYWRLIRDNCNFRRLWLAQIVSEIGDWFYLPVIFSLLLQFTRRAESVGVALVLQVLPSTLVGPTAGVANDRIRRQRVMIAADVARMVIVLGMMLVRSARTVWLVYPLLFLETVMWGFFEPARNAVIPSVVGEDQGSPPTLSLPSPGRSTSRSVPGSADWWPCCSDVTPYSR